MEAQEPQSTETKPKDGNGDRDPANVFTGAWSRGSVVSQDTPRRIQPSFSVGSLREAQQIAVKKEDGGRGREVVRGTVSGGSRLSPRDTHGEVLGDPKALITPQPQRKKNILPAWGRKRAEKRTTYGGESSFEEKEPKNKHRWSSFAAGLKGSILRKNAIVDLPSSFDPSVTIESVKNEVYKSENIPEEERHKYGIFVSNMEDQFCDDFWLEDNAENTLQSLKANPLKHTLSLRKLSVSTQSLRNTKQFLMRNGKVESAIEGVPLESGDFLPQEKKVMELHNIIHLHKAKGVIGVLHITNFQLIFCPVLSGGSVDHLGQCERRGFKIPFGNVEGIKKTGGILDIGKFYCYEIQCKDFHFVTFAFMNEDVIKLNEMVERYAFQEDPFAFKIGKDIIESARNIEVYEPIAEIGIRQQVSKDTNWRITEFNEEYKKIKSYPGVLYVPSAVKDSQLGSVAAFRSKGRIPVLVWRHSNGAALVRCSQPRTGLQGTRCEEDELLLKAVADANPNCSTLYLIDARPKANAVANTAKGCGYENTSNYVDSRLHFLGIGNIHVMRECYNKLRKSCLNKKIHEPAVWEEKKKKLKWFDNLALLLRSSLDIVALLEEKQASVVVHCSDGWDRTPQLTTLAQLILDPYYRTIQGFQVLLEKEWISFGHKFSTRLSHQKITSQTAPIFTQFIDCVWQILQQVPTAFEFTEMLLIKILKSLYSCEFGTFLMNTEYERKVADVQTRTISLWTMVNINAARYKNAEWTGLDCEKDSYSLRQIAVDANDMALWKNYYLYWKNYHD